MAAEAKVARPQKSSKKTNVFHHRLGSLTYYQACRLLGR